VNSAEENTANFYRVLQGKPLYNALCGMYTVKQNELKIVLKVSAQAGQSGVVNKTSVELMAQGDDFKEVRDARGISLIIP
jgi:hypothetical protein